MAEWSKAPVLKTGDVKASVGSNPTLSASFITGLRKYPSGRRGSPAKGVGRQKRREGSNPSFRAKKKALHFEVLFSFFRIKKRPAKREIAGLKTDEAIAYPSDMTSKQDIKRGIGGFLQSMLLVYRKKLKIG